jgi:hypothetical protein
VGQSITTCVTTYEGEVVRLVLVGDTPTLIAFTVPNLYVYRARKPQHTEVRLDLIQIEHHAYVPIGDQPLEFPTAPRVGDRKVAALQHQIAGVRAVDDHEDGPL